MKLHLPKLLRCAVLACFASVSGITSTVGTATLAGAAMMALASQASAMEVSIVSAEMSLQMNESWVIDALNGSAYSTVSYDAEAGVLTGYNGKHGLRVTMSTSWVEAGFLVHAGNVNPDNFIHIAINNGAHETVGGMPTVASNMDLVAIAEACGYHYAVSVDNFEDLDKELNKAKDMNKLCFIEVMCSIGARDDLGRPTTTAIENKENFMKFLNNM